MAEPADAADAPPPATDSTDDAAAGSKFAGLKKISMTGVIALVVILGGAACQITACVALPWRIGAGSSSSLYAGLLGPDFKERKYFMYYVKGVNKRSWHDLTVLTCDKAAKVEITVGRADDGICDTDLAAQLPEKCSKKFLPHVQDRCHVYNYVMALNAAFCIVTFVQAGVAIIVGSLGCAPILPAMKKFYLPLIMSLGFAALAEVGAWMYFTDEKFTFIGRSAEFPYPGIATGFWVHFGGGVAYIIASLFYFGDWKKKADESGEDDDKKSDADKEKGEPEPKDI